MPFSNLFGERHAEIVGLEDESVLVKGPPHEVMNDSLRAESYKYRIEKATGRTLTYLYNPPAGFKISE
ncbi:Uncharacterised protein [Mycobacteroides abscessus subsp. abscessus]|nr:Uncharacterised protein [Mycobacteroides abscessus subsp. abscessus]